MRAITLLSAVLLGATSSAWAAGTPVGYWKTIDDETSRPKSVVQVWQDDKGKVYGKIVKLYREPDEEADPVCDECEGALKNKRIIGMQIINGLSADGDEWGNGTILDPANGDFYKCYIEVEDGGKKLKVRGYIGISIIGRTQYWHQTTKPVDEVEYLK